MWEVMQSSHCTLLSRRQLSEITLSIEHLRHKQQSEKKVCINGKKQNKNLRIVIFNQPSVLYSVLPDVLLFINLSSLLQYLTSHRHNSTVLTLFQKRLTYNLSVCYLNLILTISVLDQKILQVILLLFFFLHALLLKSLPDRKSSFSVPYPVKNLL